MYNTNTNARSQQQPQRIESFAAVLQALQLSPVASVQRIATRTASGQADPAFKRLIASLGELSELFITQSASNNNNNRQAAPPGPDFYEGFEYALGGIVASACAMANAYDSPMGRCVASYLNGTASAPPLPSVTVPAPVVAVNNVASALASRIGANNSRSRSNNNSAATTVAPTSDAGWQMTPYGSNGTAAYPPAAAATRNGFTPNTLNIPLHAQQQQQQSLQYQQHRDPNANVNVNSSANNELLSPRTVSNFFPELDRYRHKSREEYQNDLRWMVINEEGSVVDLIPNGRNIAVNFADLPYFFSLAAAYRPVVATAGGGGGAVDAATSSAASVGGTEDSPTHRRGTRTLQVVGPAGYDAGKEAALFSPSHFDHGLFSPYSTASKVDVDYAHVGAGQPTVPPAAAATVANTITPATSEERMGGNSPSVGMPRNPSLQPQQHQGQGGAHANSMSRSTTRVLTSEIERRFWSSVAQLEQGTLSADSIRQLGLVFAVPTDGAGGFQELVAQGDKIRVTTNNAETFLRVLRDRFANEMVTHTAAAAGGAGAATGGGAGAGRSGISRTNSVRHVTVANPVFNPVVDEGKFSPTHFQHNLFAPFSASTTAVLDLDDAALVPQAIRAADSSTTTTATNATTSGINSTPRPGTNQQSQQQQQQQQRPPQPPAATNTAASDRRASQEAFLEVVRNSASDDGDMFLSILGIIEASPQRSLEHGVTYCLPSLCLNSSHKADAGTDPIHDLIPNGRNIPVQPNEVKDYLNLVCKVANI